MGETMGRIRRRFDAKFKEEVCQAILAGQEMREICQDHQLHHQTVQRWLDRYQQGEALGKPTAKQKAQQRQIEKLHAKIGQMAVEMDLLKKFHETLRQKKSVDTSVVTGRNLAQFQRLVKK